VRSLLGSAGETAAFCQLVNRDNLGVTLDVGHALFANENAAQSAALLAKARRLFYVHLNDNDGRADWDLLPGAVHSWELVEFLYTLRRLGYDDWFTFDIVPKECEPVEFFATAARLTRQYEAISRRIDPRRMAELQLQKNGARTLAYLHSLAGTPPQEAPAEILTEATA
jgi:xylose isomerase